MSDYLYVFNTGDGISLNELDAQIARTIPKASVRIGPPTRLIVGDKSADISIIEQMPAVVWSGLTVELSKDNYLQKSEFALGRDND